MPRVLRYAATLFLFGTLGAVLLGGAGAAVGPDRVFVPTAKPTTVLQEDGPCRHRYEAYLRKQNAVRHPADH